MKRLGALALLVLAALCGLNGSARTEEGAPLTGTLKTIKDRGTILIGYREGALPFAFLNKAGQPVGFSVDICDQIAADVAATLNSPLLEPDAQSWQKGVRRIYVPVASEARLSKVISGAVDMECGSTTATEARSKTVAFSPVFFLAGTKLMVPADSAVLSYRDLAGKVVVVSAGTTNGDVMRRLATRVSPPFKMVDAPSLDAAYTTLEIGKADAFASDDILLAGLIATKADGHRFHVVGDFLSYEPYAIVIRRDDPDFSNLVKQSFERMAKEGKLNSFYKRWFTDRLPTGEDLNLPMSPHLAEIFRVLGEPD